MININKYSKFNSLLKDFIKKTAYIFLSIVRKRNKYKLMVFLLARNFNEKRNAHLNKQELVQLK